MATPIPFSTNKRLDFLIPHIGQIKIDKKGHTSHLDWSGIFAATRGWRATIHNNELEVASEMRLHQGIWKTWVKVLAKKKNKENWSENCTDIWGLKCKSRDDLIGKSRGEQKNWKTD